MTPLRKFPPAVLLIALMPMLWACGAGIVTGALAGSDSGSNTPPPVQPTPPPLPTLTLTDAEAPLVGPQGTGLLPTVLLVNDYQLAVGATLRVELRALGVTSVQPNPVPVRITENRAQVAFFERHDEIRARVGAQGLTVADVEASLFFFVDGVQVGDPVPFTLIRQRVATLDPSLGTSQAVVSVLGGDTLRILVSGRNDETQLDNVLMQVGGTSGALQFASIVRVSAVPSGTPGVNDWLVTGLAPSNVAPSVLFVRVLDDKGGISTAVNNVFYHPAILNGAPRFVSTDGGSPVSINGQGLAPLTATGTPDFDSIRIVFKKGEGASVRELTVPQVQQGSSLTRLAFNAPPTPDGRPGPVTVRLEVSLSGGVVVQDEVEDLFVYRRPSPGFGPRGARLNTPPINMALSHLVSPVGKAPDLAVVSSLGGVPNVDLMVSEDNGMFSGYGTPFLAGQQSLPSEHNPAWIGAGDFDGDALNDLVVFNRGAPQVGAQQIGTHTFLVGQGAPLPPLQQSVGFAAQPDVIAGLVDDFDGDGEPDIVTLPSAPLAPRMFVSSPGQGMPSVSMVPLQTAAEAMSGNPLVVAEAPYDAMAMGDVDGDGFKDLVFLRGADEMKLVIAYGGGRSIVETKRFDLGIPPTSYAPDPDVAAIGVLVVPSMSGGGPLPIAVTLAGNDADTPPTLAVVRPGIAPRSYDPVLASDVVSWGAGEKVVASTLGDLDGAPGSEIVIGISDTATAVDTLRMVRWDGMLREITVIIVRGIEPMTGITSLVIGPAASPDGVRFVEEKFAVFVQHQFSTSTGIEDRISTWFARPGPPFQLLAPDAALVVTQPVLGLAVGDFSGASSLAGPGAAVALDAMTGSAGELRALSNDAVGGFPVRKTLTVPGLVPETLASAALALPSVMGDCAVFLRDDGQLGILLPGARLPATPSAAPIFSGTDLRSYAPASVASLDVAATSRIITDDVDGDAVQDLVVMLVLGPTGSAPSHTMILLLRGKRGATVGEFPVHMPAPQVTVVTESEAATAIALGDFVFDPAARTPLELAVAIPQGSGIEGNQVRFYRYSAGSTAPDDDTFVRSFAEPGVREELIAGDQPTQLVAADFDSNGAVDLAVASEGDSRVHLFLNSGLSHTQLPNEVNIAGFVESSTAPALPPGRPTGMLKGDLNGDGVVDLLVLCESFIFQKNQNIVFYLSTGTGNLAPLSFLSNVRSGNRFYVGPSLVLRDASVVPAMGDFNRDGLLDLMFGWSTSGAGDRNLRVLFGAAR